MIRPPVGPPLKLLPRAVAYTLQPWQVLRAAIDFLREENRVLLEQLGDRRIRLTNVAAVVFTSPA